MSDNAVKAFRSFGPHLPDLIARAAIPHSRRVAVEALYLVGERLSYLYDPDRRGYVDESVDQIRDELAGSGWEIRDTPDGARLVRRS